ncbi:Leukotriene A-4 hydrolase [Pitangus sulphuratus]|nr:Leukotriene A-4 hydrolase [Pitangus sulphuratus]
MRSCCPSILAPFKESHTPPETSLLGLETLSSEPVLDTRDVQVFKVTINGQDAQFAFGEKHSFKGTPLEITFPKELRSSRSVIDAVSPGLSIGGQGSPIVMIDMAKAEGLFQAVLVSPLWGSSLASASGRFPIEQVPENWDLSFCSMMENELTIAYLLNSMNLKSTHCRAIFPCQDTPAVKLTYYAEVDEPKSMCVLTKDNCNNGWVTFQISVPKELVALMSANRDGEMPDPEDSSRKIYRFSQNIPIPCYLFALVVGALESRKIGPRTLVWAEKELVDKSAYEFSETEAMLKTAEDLAGPYVWGQYDLLVLPPSFPFGGMENPCLTFVTPTLLAGDRSLSNINTLGDKNPVTNLVLDLDVDPDVAFSSVPYEKGFALLFYLEQLLGGPDVFMGFLKAYVQQFAYKSIVTEDWKKFLYSYFKDKVDVLDKVDWNSWLHAPGMPPVKPTYDMTLANACVALSQRWIEAKESDLGSFNSADLKEMSSHQLIEFLALLLLEAPLPLSHVKRMQEVYDFNAIHNSEIRFRWLRLCIRSKWEEAIPLALKMATDQGRIKFTRPLFRDLYSFVKSRDLAVKTFLEHRPSMHPVTSMLVGIDLKQDQ